ncbi:unconventional myosin-XVIIIa isoform X2 [Herrania umbratica]|uniref:Unconventional myosin-XVIIIa isoform X2 n=1 Tax=Herrania umbratica TaxID=108875 RepID=A0A6J1BNU6_9ROSI|nr:unconventional myosin-XVIIIa isoform X2 [Herrania umbratica]
MFKSWRSDKKKIKVVFKLQFQATQVPRLKKSAVTIALVPEDVGKPTLRLEKVAVQDGSCLWENPVFETVKLIRETKTGKLSEKIYHFVVSTGSSKAGFLGEASIDFADFAVETEPITVSLPLKFANSGAILHVTIHKIEGDADQRYLGETEGFAISRDGSLQSQDNNYSVHENDQNFTEDGHLNMITYQNAEQNGSIKASNGSTATVASCWDICSEQPRRASIGQDPASFLSPLRLNSIPQRGAGAVTTKKQMHRRTNTDWSVCSTSDGSLVESGNSPKDIPREWQEGSDSSVEKLRSENALLLRQVEVSELELESLRKQILKETKRTQDLAGQIISLKEERDAVKTEFKQLKSHKNTDEAEIESRLQAENEESNVLLEEIRQELNHEKDLNTNLRLQLQKTEDSNSNLILAVRDLNEMLEQKNREISCLSSEIEASMNMEEVQSSSKCHLNEAEDQKTVEELNKEQNDANEVHMMKQTVTDLNAELEFYRKHKEELEMHIEELSQENEVLKRENYDISSQLKQNEQQESIKMQNEYLESLATINELESQVQRLEDKIKQQSEEYSESLVAINELESQVKELKKVLENRTQRFEDDLNTMMHAKTEQEERAIRAEEALRKTRWKNAVTAERLQEEFKRLSIEMATKFDENEKMTTKAVAEANELHIQKRNLEEMLQKANEELELLKDRTGIERQELSHQLDIKAKQIEQMSMELNDKTMRLEHTQKQEKEKQEAFSKEIQMLRTEIEKLTEQRSQFSDEAKENGKQSDETIKVKTSSDKTEVLIQRWNKEREELEKKIASAKKEAEKAQKQLISTRSLKDKKEMMITNLKSEMENIQVEYNDLKHKLIREEMEKEKLRKQVSQLKNDLQKKEEETISLEKQPKNNGGQAAVTPRSSNSTSAPQGSKSITMLQKKLRLLKDQINLKEAASKTSANSAPEKERNLSNMIEQLESSMEQLKICHCISADHCQEETISAGIFAANVTKSEERGKSPDNMLHSKMNTAEGMSFSTRAVPVERRKETNAEREHKCSTSDTNTGANLAELLCEVECLKERNKSMERELKDMEERYSEISLKFAEVEGERQQLVMTVRNLKNSKKS